VNSLEKEEFVFEITPEDLMNNLSKKRRGEIGSSDVLVLPNKFNEIENIDTQPFNEEAIHLHKILREKEIHSELLEGEKHRPTLELRGFEVILPPIILLASDPLVQSFVINIVSNYVYDKIKRLSKKEKEQTPIQLEVIKSDNKGNLLSVKYKGTANDFEEISKDLKQHFGVDSEKQN
jgi:hypothetical protein